jgi:hypothetical protein
MSEKEMTKDEGMANSFAMEGGALRRQTNIPRSAQKPKARRARPCIPHSRPGSPIPATAYSPITAIEKLRVSAAELGEVSAPGYPSE